MTASRLQTVCGDGGEVCNRESPSQAVALEVDVHQMLVSEDEGLGVFVLQVVHHCVIGIAPAVQVQQAVLPPAEVAHLTYSHRQIPQGLTSEQAVALKQQN